METRETRADMSAYHVCQDCYMAAILGADSPHIEYGETWDRDRFTETVNSIAELGTWVYDGVDMDSDTDDGYTVFSKQACDMCGDHLAGHRYRLFVG